MSTTPISADALHHHSRQMRGRDRHESHRAATPLELLFDLTFVVSFGLGVTVLTVAIPIGVFRTRQEPSHTTVNRRRIAAPGGTHDAQDRLVRRWVCLAGVARRTLRGAATERRGAAVRG